MEESIMKKYVAEFIGTLILVFMGCGSAVFLGCDVPGGHLAVALAFGLSIVATAYVIGNISGCHINPVLQILPAVWAPTGWQMPAAFAAPSLLRLF